MRLKGIAASEADKGRTPRARQFDPALVAVRNVTQIIRTDSIDVYIRQGKKKGIDRGRLVARKAKGGW